MRWLLALLLTLAALPASAQVIPSGPFTSGHTTRCQNATCTVVVDAGGAAGSAHNGVGYLTELGVTNTGTPICINDALTSGAYHQLCLGAFSLGAGLISYNAFNGASALGLFFDIDGTTYPFPGTGTGMSLVVDNTSLMALSTTAVTGVGVIRKDVAIGYGAPPQLFFASSNACTLNAGAGDVGTQVPSANGKCWIAQITSEMDFRQFHPIRDGVTDVSTAYNDWIAACGASVAHQCFWPGGVFAFTTQPACIALPVHIYAPNDMGATEIKRNYNGVGTKGLICVQAQAANGTVVENLLLESTVGTTGGSLISLVTPDADSLLGLFRLSNIRLTDLGDCTHDYGLYIDGTLRTTSAAGIRDISLSNIEVFGAAIAPVAFYSTIGLDWHGGFINAAGCSTTPHSLIVGGASGTPGSYNNIDVSVIDKGIVLGWANFTKVSGAYLGDASGVSVANTTSQTNGALIEFADASGTAQENWSQGRFVTGRPKTWTPTLLGKSTAGTLVYAGGTNGHYSVGPNLMVTASFYIQLSSVSVAPTGSIAIGGFPLSAGTGADSNCRFSYLKTATFDSGYTYLGGLMDVGAKTMLFYEQGSDKTPAALAASASASAAGTLLIDTATEIHGVCTYSANG